MLPTQQLASITGQSTRLTAFLAVFLFAVLGSTAALRADRPATALLAVGIAAVAAILLVLELLLSERRRHEVAEEELVGQASFLESLIESLNAIASARDAGEILERTRAEAERLFGAEARLDSAADSSEGDEPTVVSIALPAGGDEIAVLRLVRARPFERSDVARATLLGRFAARALENARLLDEASVREAERSRLSDQLITAEQGERRRLAVFLHDTSVQSLSGIALMLDAARSSLEDGRLEDARTVLGSALERHRDTIRSLRTLSFNLEPIVLRDQGFGPAVDALADQLGVDRNVAIEVEVSAADALGERAQAALYQIIREALHGAIHRRPSRIEIRVQESGGAIETLISDDAPGERRRASFDAIAERARTLNGRLEVEQGSDGGTTVRVTLPPYAAQT